MLRSFINIDGFKRIPHACNAYSVDVRGNLIETVSKKPVKLVDVDGIRYIPESLDVWFEGMELSKLLSITFRNPIQDVRRLEGLDLIFRDGDRRNFRLSNTLWRCPEGKHTHPLYPGFCFIPGYSRYLINRAGKVISTEKGDYLEHYTDANGYLMYGVLPDVGKRTIVGMHRLLCLTYKPYTGDVDKLDVNHIDGVTSNNPLNNLEWETRSGNNLHAYRLGLKNASITPVLVRSVITGEIERYYSLEECARHFNIDGETVRQRVLNKRSAEVVYAGEFQFKLESDDKPWKIFDRLNDYVFVTTSKTVYVESIKTGNARTFESITETAAYFNVSPSAITYWFKRADENGVVFRNHLMKYVTL